MRFARTAVDDALVGPALRARRTARLGPGGRLVLRGARAAAQLPPLARADAAERRDRARAAAHAGLAVVVRRGRAAARRPARRPLRISGGQGALLVLVVGGAGSAQDVRLTLTA